MPWSHALHGGFEWGSPVTANPPAIWKAAQGYLRTRQVPSVRFLR